MKVAMIGGGFVAEGSYAECAAWAYSMITLERDFADRQMQRDAEREAEIMAESLNNAFEEFIRREKKGEDEPHD